MLELSVEELRSIVCIQTILVFAVDIRISIEIQGTTTLEYYTLVGALDIIFNVMWYFMSL